jgi:hypothetical protein
MDWFEILSKILSMYWFQIIQSIGSVGTAAALVVLAIQADQTKQNVKLAKTQLTQTEEQMELVKKEMRYNFRPWIYRENFDESTPLYIEFDHDKKRITIRLNFKNYGRLGPLSKFAFVNFNSEYIDINNDLENGSGGKKVGDGRIQTSRV